MSATATNLALQLSVPRLQPTTVPPGPTGPSRPQLRVLEGGRAPGQVAQRAVYRRRRLMALVLVLAMVVALTVLATAALARFAGGDPSPAGDPSNGAVTAAPTVVVAPGDTLWSIAAAVAPDTDVRITVDQLIELNGSSPIVPGQELVLPS